MPRKTSRKTRRSTSAARQTTGYIAPSWFPEAERGREFPPDDDWCSAETWVPSSGPKSAAASEIDWNKVLPELLPGNGILQDVALTSPLLAGPDSDLTETRLPGSHSRRTRIIVGPEDDRRRITNPRDIPFGAICHLEIAFPSGAGELGTGWLVAPKLVVTAGHCVWNRRKGGFASSIVVSPGRNGLPHWYSQTVTPQGGRFRTTPEMGNARQPSPENDYGCILLPHPFPAAGHLGVAVYDDSTLKHETFNVVGYPSDKPWGTMWGHARRLAQVRTRRVEYAIDTEAGQSGSPVFDRVERGGSTQFLAVGIHNAGSPTTQRNLAVRITSDVFDRLHRWIALSTD